MAGSGNRYNARAKQILKATPGEKTRMKRAGMALIISGILVLAFFVGTDVTLVPGWMERVGWGHNQVDAVADARWGTVIGVAGSATIIASGLWLLVRRSI